VISAIQTPKGERRAAVKAPRLVRGTWSWLLRVGMLLAPVLIFATAAGAQTPVPAQAARQPLAKTFMSKSAFYLPVIIDDRVRGNLSEIQLYVKDHPARPWMLKEKAAPSTRGFTYHATQDGEYWFNVVTVDRAGHMTPADLSNEPPGLVVVLDTQSPQLDVRPLPSSSEGLFVRCEVRDANPDPMKTRMEYQTADRVWRGADPVPGQADTFVIPQQAVFNGMVRVTATDRASNSATREFNVGAMAAAMNMPGRMPTETPLASTLAKAPPALPPAPPALPTSATTDSLLPDKLGPSLPPTDTITAKSSVLPGSPGQAMPVVYQTTDTTTKRVSTPTAHVSGPSLVRQLVNNTHVFLEYQIEQVGPSGVGKVEVWMTRDQGQSWTRIGQALDHKSPVEVDLPGEGLFGVSLSVSNGRGFGGAPPSAGDAADWWIEVDTTRPSGEFHGVQPSAGSNDCGLVINWTAHDKNLGSEPIDLYYSAHREGPWQVIAKGLKNDGHYRWSVPTDAGSQAYLRLVVTDRAGNSMHCDSPQPVLLDDMSRPRGHVVGVTTTAPRTNTAAAN
jgi:hypothetical protein